MPEGKSKPPEELQDKGVGKDELAALWDIDLAQEEEESKAKKEEKPHGEF